MKEVEVLVKIKDDPETAKLKLSNFKFEGVKNVFDVYFFDSKRDDLKPKEDFRLEKCFRIRQCDDKNFLTYKVDHFDENGIWTYSDEHETEVLDFDSAMKIIKHLGFEELVSIENEKYTYMTYFYEIVLENVKNLGLFLEVELINAENLKNEDIETEKQGIRKFIEFIGFEFEELNMGKPEMMLKYKNKNIMQ